MKKIVIISTILLILIAVVIVSVQSGDDKEVKETTFTTPRSGVAIIMTGAAARIPQEAALLETMYNRGMMKNLVFISGVSSGALNSVVLNGVLEGKMTWGEYKSILYNLRNRDIFFQNEKKIPVNTAPARELYKKIVEDKLGYHSIGDLPFATGISFTHIKDLDLVKTVYRMCSVKINQETDTSLSLVDIMMASSAFPVVFPPCKIKNVKTIPDYEFVDGGVGEDHVPYHALLEFEKYRGVGVEKVYIISRKSDSVPEMSEELKGLGINDRGLFDKLDISFDAILKKDILKRLEAYTKEAPGLVPLTYVWIPEFKGNYMLFNFENLKEQYVLTSLWAETNNPIPIKDYLLKNNIKVK